VTETSLVAWDPADEATTELAGWIVAEDGPRLSFVYLGAGTAAANPRSRPRGRPPPDRVSGRAPRPATQSRADLRPPVFTHSYARRPGICQQRHRTHNDGPR
jgi:hypothetical protein